MLADLIKGKIDILLISETKIDNSFPASQFEIKVYTPFRLDGSANGGGLLLYIRNYIPAKKLPILGFGNIGCIILGINISNKKMVTGGGGGGVQP